MSERRLLDHCVTSKVLSSTILEIARWYAVGPAHERVLLASASAGSSSSPANRPDASVLSWRDVPRRCATQAQCAAKHRMETMEKTNMPTKAIAQVAKTAVRTARSRRSASSLVSSASSAGESSRGCAGGLKGGCRGNSDGAEAGDCKGAGRAV
eukprot:2465399-Pleurochrysis_carterae.AAC.1